MLNSRRLIGIIVWTKRLTVSWCWCLFLSRKQFGVEVACLRWVSMNNWKSDETDGSVSFESRTGHGWHFKGWKGKQRACDGLHRVDGEEMAESALWASYIPFPAIPLADKRGMKFDFRISKSLLALRLEYVFVLNMKTGSDSFRLEIESYHMLCIHFRRYHPPACRATWLHSPTFPHDIRFLLAPIWLCSFYNTFCSTATNPPTSMV